MAGVNLGTQKLMYLPKDYWSPRYDSTFFTVKIDAKYFRSEPHTAPSVIGGKFNLPAYYFEVVILREHKKTSLLRRYSQFKWMYDQLVANPPKDRQPPDSAPIQMPPGSCFFQRQDEGFAQNRMEQLETFLDDVLSRPGYSSHPAVKAFLQLDESS